MSYSCRFHLPEYSVGQFPCHFDYRLLRRHVFPLPSIIRAEFGVVDDRLPRRLHHQRAKRLVAAESLRPLRLPLPGIVGCRDEPEERGERPLVWETRHVASDFPYQVHRRQRYHYRRRHQRITTGSICVYPNPATDFIRINNSGNAIGTVKLVDMSGRTVGEYDFKAENAATIDVSTLEKGVYFLITDNGKLKVIKR